MRSLRQNAHSLFATEKTPVTASRGLVAANHPLASAAGIELLAAGGNAVDAAIGALFTLTVVEPAMVGIVGGGMALVRLADGREIVIDGMAAAPLSAKPDTYGTISNGMAEVAGDGGAAQQGRRRLGGGARQSHGLVPHGGALRPASPRRRARAGDTAVIARLQDQPTPRRLHPHPPCRHPARSGRRGDPHA